MKFPDVRMVDLIDTDAFEFFNIPVKNVEVHVSAYSINFAIFTVLPEIPGRFKFIIKPVVVEIACYP